VLRWRVVFSFLKLLLPLQPILSIHIAVTGGLFRRTFLKSHNIGIADAVIAATAETERGIVVTLNRKHFPMFSNVIVPYQKS
jgi:predicted nucleic acid-binding protein